MIPLEPFLDALTKVCNDHGIGIEGGTLFVMEPEDRRSFYIANDASELVREERRLFPRGGAMFGEGPN